MKHLRQLVTACMILMPTLSLGAEEYGYPVPDAYAASILGTPAKLRPDLPAKIRARDLVLDVIPGRKLPPVFYYNDGLRCTFAYQKQRAPLVFLIAGTGAGNQSPHQLVMMKALYQAGFHVITLPSPTTPNFIMSASRLSIPGDMDEDAADLYRAMESAWSAVKDEVEVSDFYLSGYSLGGTQAGFVARLDEERKIFNFRKVLMINPVVSIYSAAVRIEELLKAIPGGPAKVGYFFNRMLDKFSEFYIYGDFNALNEEFIYEVYKEQLFSREEAGGLIGLAFRINSGGMIFCSDVMTNSGYVVPRNRVLSASESLYDYFMVSTHLSLFNYFNEYLYPSIRKRRPDIGKQEFIDSLSLKSIGNYLQSSGKFGVMTNADDFLLSASDLDYLKRIFGDRIMIYPRGGHLGNIEYKENLAHMIEFFKR